MSKSTVPSKTGRTLQWFICRSHTSCGSGHLGSQLWESEATWNQPDGVREYEALFSPASWPVSSLPIWTFLKPKDRPLWALLQKWLQVPEKDPFVHIKLQALLTLHVSREPLMGKCYVKTVLSSPAADSTFVKSNKEYPLKHHLK